MVTNLNKPEPAALDADLRAAALRWSVYWLIIAVASAIVLGRILAVARIYDPSGRTWPEKRPAAMPTWGANDRSRWCTVWSLVERRTYVIDEIHERDGWQTIDKVHRDGHFYSSKPPLLSTVVAGEYWLIKRLTGWTLDDRPWEIVRTVLLTVNWVPFVVYLVLLARLAERFGATDWGRLYVLLAAAAATFLTTFLNTLNNHTAAAMCALFAVYPAMRIWHDDDRRWHRFALAGFFAALTSTHELPAAVFGVALFAALVVRWPVPTLSCFVPAALLPIAGFLVTNYLSTGGILPYQVQPDSQYYQYEVAGVPSYWKAPVGIDAAHEPKAIYAFHVLLGHHGIFSLSPIFLLTLGGIVMLVRRPKSPVRMMAWLTLAVSAVVLAFYIVKTHNYGGVTSGFRWAFWLTPLWLVAMLPAADGLAGRRWTRAVGLALLAISVVSASYPTWTPWRHPWLYNLMEYLRLIHYG